MFRHFLAPLAAAATLCLASTADAATRTWAGGDGGFFDPARWLQNLAPGPDDDIHIGNLAAAAGATVTMGGQWGGVYGSLNLTNGVTLDMNGSELIALGTATLSGSGTRLIARPAGYYNQRDFQARLLIGAGARFELHDQVAVNLFQQSVNDGTLQGRGDVYLGAGFVNNGFIRPGNNGGLRLSLGDAADHFTDLDGSGTGGLDLTAPFAELHVIGHRLGHSFGGQVSMVHGSLLDMQLASGWVADSTSRITVLGFNNAAAAQIVGAPIDFHGELSVGLAEGKLRVLAPMTVHSGARIEVGHSDALRFEGSTQVQGGRFTLDRFGTLEFNGPTTLTGGSFASHSTDWNDGSIVFNGATTWSGVVTLSGTARQQGTATVSGFGGATIRAQRLDMDGLSGTTWNLHSRLTVQAQQIGTTPANRFGGTLNIGGGFAPRLAMQLDDPNASWIMSGTLNLGALTHLVETKLEGSRMVVEGRVNIGGGRVRIDADTRFADTAFSGPAVVTFETAGTELWLGGRTEVDAGAQFVGIGALHNAAGGELSLAHGASLGQVDLVNEGVLNIGRQGGAATAHGFANLASGHWVVDLGGHAPGTEHDLLTVFGSGAVLDGMLSLALVNLGHGMFQPIVGDEFTILLAPGGVSGTFDNRPVTVAGGWVYNWNVLYRSDEVRLQLAGVSAVPEPGAWAMLLAGLAGMGSVARRRRRR
jgi:hypothetical protein